MNDDLRLHYQPIVDLRSRSVTGAEALLRIDQAELGVMEPREFLPLAEDNGLILAFGEWVLLAACAQAKVWYDAGRPFTVAVNISKREFDESNLPKAVREALAATQLPAEYLELDLTESLLVADVDRAILMLHELNELGVKLVLDDFGTGYSSLQYLQRFPLHALKIDMSFVHGLPINRDDAVIVRTILAISRELNYETIAEGVEHEAQLEFLRQHGCDRVQGYLIGRPVPAADFSSEIERASECVSLVSAHALATLDSGQRGL
ncbi:MAG: EAL domain-containing protein [Cyanobacteria bacterium J06642_2]